MDFLGSLTSVDVYDWVTDLDNININGIHKGRHCELLLIAEKKVCSSIKLRMMERYARTDFERDLYFITLQDIYDFVENYRMREVYIEESIQKIVNGACREGTRYLQTGEPIPIDLLMKLVKLKIIFVIKKDIHDYRKGVILGQRGRFLEGPPAAPAKGKRKKSKKTSSKKSNKSATGGSKKGKKKAKGKRVAEDICLPYLVSKPAATFPADNMEIPDKVIYIALMGFYMKEIFEHLLSNDIKLRCVIEFHDKTRTVGGDLVHVLAHRHYNSRQFGDKLDTLHVFWCKVYDVFIHEKVQQTSESFIMAYTPLMIIRSKCQNGDDYLAQCRQLFLHFSEAVHKINDFKRYHRNYVDKLKVQGLGGPPHVISARCMELYDASLNVVPVECVDVQLVLDCLLGEVCHRVKNVEDARSHRSSECAHSEVVCPDERRSARKNRNDKSVGRRSHGDFRDQLKKIFEYHKLKNPKYVKRIAVREYECPPSSRYGLKNENFITHERNLLERNLYCYDKLHEAVFHVHINYLKMNTCVKLWDKYPALSLSNDTAEFNKQLIELCSVVGMDVKDLLSCINVLMFGRINCSGTTDSYADVFDEMEKYFPIRNDVLQMIPIKPEITTYRDSIFEKNLTNAYEQSHLHEFSWTEELSSTVLLQEVNKMLEHFECVDHMFVPIFDVIYFRLHHNADDFGIATNKWASRIRTPVDLNDFLTFVLHEDNKFVITEELMHTEVNKLYEEIVVKETRRINQFEIKSDDFTLKDSIKEKCKRAALQPEEKQSGKNKGKKAKKGGKNKKIPKKAKSKKSKSSKKSTGKMPLRDAREIIEGSKLQVDIDIQDIRDAVHLKVPPQYLDAYDFDERIAVSGSSTVFYSLDPMKVIVNRFMLTGNPPRISVRMDINRHSMTLHAYAHKGFAFHYDLKKGGSVVFGRDGNVNCKAQIKKMRDVYLLNEKRIQAIKCFDQNVLLKRRLLVAAEYLRQIIDLISSGKEYGRSPVSSARFNASSLISSDKYNVRSQPSTVTSERIEGAISRKQFLQELTSLKATTSLFNPRFKICSSRLHKYSYVKRVTSPIALELKRIKKFMNCKDDYGLCKLIKIKKCYPIPNKTNLFENFSNYDVRMTLQNGLHIRNVPGIAPCHNYINQFFFSKGPQHAAIATEESRTFLRCGFVVVRHTDGTLTLYGGSGRIIKFDVPLVKKSKNGSNNPNRCTFRRKVNYNENVHKFVVTLKRHVNRLARRARDGRDSQFTTSRKGFDCNIRKLKYDPDILMLAASDDFNFTLITTDGKRVKFKKGKIVENNCYYISKEEEIRSNRFVFHREDGTVIILTNEGYVQTTYTDNTRITTWFELGNDLINIDLTSKFGNEARNMGAWIIVDMFYQYEHPNYATVTCSGNKATMILQMPDDVLLRHDNDDAYSLKLDEFTSSTVTTDTVRFESAPCPGCQRICSCVLNVKHLYELEDDITGQETLLTASDTYNKTFTVTYDGTCKRNDDYDLCESHCDHILHKKQSSQTYFIMNRDCSGKLMWTDHMYNDRLLESQLASNQTAILYTDQENLVVQTSEFRVYEKDKYRNRFTMSYLPTLVPYYKQSPFDFGSANFTMQRLLRCIPGFKEAAPFYVTLINRLVQYDDRCTFDNSQLAFFGNYLSTKSDTISFTRAKKPTVRRKKLRETFKKRIAEWKSECKVSHKAVVEFNTKPFSYFSCDLTKEPSDNRMLTRVGEDSSSDQSSEKFSRSADVASYRSMGTNTLIPFYIESELQLERTDAGDLPIVSAEIEDPSPSQNISTILKSKLLDYISNILGHHYNTDVDDDGGNSIDGEIDHSGDDHESEKRIETSKFDSEEVSDQKSVASSVPEYLKCENYRAAHRLFTNPKRNEGISLVRQRKFRTERHVPAGVCLNERGKKSTTVDKEKRFKHEQEMQKTQSLKVICSKILDHPSYSDAELLLTMRSSEMRKLEQERDEIEEKVQESVAISLGDASGGLHQCRLCLNVPFVRQVAPLYKRDNFLGVHEYTENDKQILKFCNSRDGTD